MKTKRDTIKTSIRDQVTIDLSEDSIRALNHYVTRRGGRGTKKFFLSKLVEWFVEQPDVAKSAVIGWIDEGMEAAYAGVLRKLADDVESRAAGSRVKFTGDPKGGA